MQPRVFAFSKQRVVHKALWLNIVGIRPICIYLFITCLIETRFFIFVYFSLKSIYLVIVS